jgi:hypothetical protein
VAVEPPTVALWRKASLFSDAPFLFKNLAAACRAAVGETDSAMIVTQQQRTAASVIKIFLIVVIRFYGY